MAPSTTKAIVIKAKGHAAVETVATPQLRDNYILVKTTAVALNPTDWAHIDFLMGAGLTGSRVGCDYAGVVEEVGSKVTKSFKKGDRIAGVVHGANQLQLEDGAFAEYIVVNGDIQIKIPDNVSDQEAATLGVGITTVGQGLYQALKLPLPTNPAAEPFPILIYGGSTATGLLGIQFAKLSGLTVITTASPRNAAYLRTLGADAVVDHASASCAADIRAAAGGRPLLHAWDCIGRAATARVCAAALADDDRAVYAALLRVADEEVRAVNARARVAPMTLAYTVHGEDIVKWFPIAAKPEDFEFGKMFWELARELLASGKVKAARQTVNRGGEGLEGVLYGLQQLKEGKVSGEKLVYTL